jgi:hypothetical protein
VFNAEIAEIAEKTFKFSSGAQHSLRFLASDSAIEHSILSAFEPHCHDMFDWWKKSGPARSVQAEARREPTRAVRAPGGRYEAVCRYVENRYADTVVLTFAEVEDLLGFSLPDLARVQLEWWASSLAVASRTVTPNLTAEIVSFERTS